MSKRFFSLLSLDRNSRRAMTLAELVVSAGLLTVVLTGILISYLRAIELQEVAASTSIATKAAMSRIEQILATTFNQIKPMYHTVAFAVPGMNAMGVSYINDSTPGLLLVTVSISWRQRIGRAYGEDANLNGVIDGTEDVNGNGMLDAPVQLVTKIFKK